jgi:hypothetical protein
MIRALFVSAFVFFAACGGVGQPVGSAEEAVSDNACHYRCNHCPPNQVCALYCVQSGNCDGMNCIETQLCIIGYHFDSRLCKCVPDAGQQPVPCGNSFCAAGDVCCNASCGICTPPDGVCIQIACEQPL